MVMEYEEDGIVSESCDDSVCLYEEEGFPVQLLSALNEMRQQVARAFSYCDNRK